MEVGSVSWVFAMFWVSWHNFISTRARCQMCVRSAEQHSSHSWCFSFFLLVFDFVFLTALAKVQWTSLSFNRPFSQQSHIRCLELLVFHHKTFMIRSRRESVRGEIGFYRSKLTHFHAALSECLHIHTTVELEFTHQHLVSHPTVACRIMSKWHFPHFSSIIESLENLPLSKQWNELRQIQHERTAAIMWEVFHRLFISALLLHFSRSNEELSREWHGKYL